MPRPKEVTPMQRLAWVRARTMLASKINQAWKDRCRGVDVGAFGSKLVSPQGLGYALWLMLVEKQPNLEALKAFDPSNNEIDDMSRLWAAEPEMLTRLALDFGDRMACDRLKAIEAEQQTPLLDGVAR